jgi:hypothetical protein
MKKVSKVNLKISEVEKYDGWVGRFRKYLPEVEHVE